MYRTLSVFSSLVLLFCTAAFSQNETSQNSPRALLKVFGEHVRVNGQTVADVTTVFDGDRIETGSDSAATLLQPGHMLALNQNSSAVFRNGALVKSGQSVSSSSGISAAVVTSPDPKKKCISPKKPDKCD